MTPVAVTRKKFTVEEYHQMIETGVLREDDRLELLDGEIIEMSPIGPRHASCVKKLSRWFWKTLGNRVIVSVQDPIVLVPDSEPQPDVALLVPRSDFYAERHPEPQDVFLAIEVADTSQEYDREVKIPAYARAGIREAWLVDLEARTVTVYREPRRGKYRQVAVLDNGDFASPLAFPRARLKVREILA